MSPALALTLTSGSCSQPCRGVCRVPPTRPTFSPRICICCQVFHLSLAWPTCVSAPTDEFCSLAQMGQGTNPILALLHTSGFCRLAQTYLLPGLVHTNADRFCSPTQPGLSQLRFLSKRCDLVGELSKVHYQVKIPFLPASATILLVMACFQFSLCIFWSMLQPSSAQLSPPTPGVSGGFLSEFCGPSWQDLSIPTYLLISHWTMQSRRGGSSILL